VSPSSENKNCVNPSHANKVADATEPDAIYGLFSAKLLNAFAVGEFFNLALMPRSIAKARVKMLGRSTVRVAAATFPEATYDRGTASGSIPRACREIRGRSTALVGHAA
jgi:hypothetical protein